MKHTRLAVITLFSAALLLGGKQSPSGLSVTCGAGTAPDGNCLAGDVTFTGSNYPHNYHLLVVGDGVGTIDDFDYTAPQGNISFTEGMSPATTYHVTVTYGGGKNSTTETLDLVTE